MRKIAIALSIVLAALSGMAQETVLVQDFESWNAVKVSKDFGKIDVDAQLQARWNDNASSLSQYFGQVGVEYKLFKPVTIGMAYRFIKQNEKEGFVKGGRIQFDAMYDKKLGDFKLDTRLRYQNRSEEDELDNVSKIRFKAGLRFNISGWKLDPKFSAEYFRVLDGEASRHDKMRYTLGTKYKINKHNSIGIYYRLETELKENYPADYYILGLNYNIKF